MNAPLTGDLYLHDGQWVGIPDTYFEVRGAGLSGPVHYDVEFGYETGPEGWVEIRLSYKDGLLPLRIVVGPEDRKVGVVLGEVFQAYTGIITVRFGYHTPPAPPKPILTKSRASEYTGKGWTQWSGDFGGYDAELADAEEVDADGLDDMWDEQPKSDSEMQQKINKLLGITKDETALGLPQGNPDDDRPVWVQKLEQEGHDTSDGDHFRQVMEEGGGWKNLEQGGLTGPV